jgi:hypothetical protein
MISQSSGISFDDQHVLLSRPRHRLQHPRKPAHRPRRHRHAEDCFLERRRRAHKWPAASRSDWPFLCLGDTAALRSARLRVLQRGLSRRRAMKTSQPIEAIGFLHPKTGYEIPVRIRAVPVHNRHGAVIGAVETFEELKPAANVRDRDDGPQLPGCIDGSGYRSPRICRPAPAQGGCPTRSFQTAASLVMVQSIIKKATTKMTNPLPASRNPNP